MVKIHQMRKVRRRRAQAAVVKIHHEGLSNRAIADVLGVDRKTVDKDMAQNGPSESNEQASHGAGVAQNGPAAIPLTDKKAAAEAYKQNRAGDLEQSRATRIDNIAEIAKGNAARALTSIHPFPGSRLLDPFAVVFELRQIVLGNSFLHCVQSGFGAPFQRC